MDTLEKKLDIIEKQKLENMYLGDKSRDASDKIRGFLFQDLVALNYLLDEGTEYVCLEFLEDVDVFCNDGTLKIIQVKYYPKKNPIMSDILTDLYYQFLRTEILDLKIETKFELVIHRKNKIKKPTLKKMKTYITSSKTAKPEPRENPGKWLIDNIYELKKKVDQKNVLFEIEANDKSISKFLGRYETVLETDIINFKDIIAEKLEEEFSNFESIEDEDDRKKILIGLAVLYMQRRYILNDPTLDELKVTKSEFISYIRRTVESETEEHIVGYLTYIVGERYTSIIESNPDMSEEKILLLNYIASNTQIWISKLASTKEGQYKLINTFSYKDEKKVKNFIKLSLSGRRIKIAECSDNIEIFLKFLWKIMLNLCCYKKDFDLNNDADMLDPKSYIDESIEKYICLKFKQDFVDTSIILPPVRGANRNEDYKNICSRMYLEKPQKWFMSGYECGKKEYSYNAAIINEYKSVIDTEDDSYFIECMDCIKVDEKQWEDVENCDNCIFAKNCINGKEY